MSERCIELKARAAALYPKGDDVRLERGRYDEPLSEAQLAALRTLIAALDRSLESRGIAYFATGDLLACALSYGDLHPQMASCSIGMLRSEYDKLELSSLVDDGLELQVAVEGLLPVARSGEAGGAEILIDLYDAVPDDFDLATFQRYEIKALRGRGASAGNVRRIWRIAGSYNGRTTENVSALIAGDVYPVRRAAVEQVERVPFGAGSISVPADPSHWFTPVDRARPRIEANQRASLAIALEIDRVCRENGIGYFICGGTLLGSVRGDGFLPWDDDIDIAMLREDYERFLELAPHELSGEMFLQTRASDPNIPYVYSKVRLRGTHDPTPYVALHDMEDGISVDIFPFDRIPAEDVDEALAYVGRALELDAAVKRIAATKIREGLPHRASHNPVEAVGRQLVKSRRARLGKGSLADAQDAYDAHVRQYGECGDLQCVTSCVPTFTCVELAELLPYGRRAFEGHELSVPADPEAFLRMQYGDDFMTPPPPHLRSGHAAG